VLDGLPSQAFVAIGAVAAALVAGFFSFLNLVTSKEQKVSEFRQTWIDELRQEIARYTAAVTFLSMSYSAYKDKNQKDKDIFKFYETVRESYEQIVHAYTSISLRVNRNEKNERLRKLNQDFIDALEEIRKLFNEGKLKEARLHCDSLRDHSKPILKEEWKRVKKGELTYRVSKAIAGAILLLGLVGTVYVVTLYHGGSGNPKPATEEKTEAKQPAIKPTNEKTVTKNPANKPLEPTR